MNPVAANPAADAPSSPAAALPATAMPPTMATTAAADPLAQLRGLHLPEPVGFWPPAPGWWAISGLLVLAAVTAAWARRRRRASLGARALRELRRIEQSRAPDLQSLATSLAQLLRRVALERFGTAMVAKLSGESWERFLRETMPAPRRGVVRDENAGRLLSRAPYAPPALWCADGADLDRARLVAAARTWIRGNT